MRARTVAVLAFAAATTAALALAPGPVWLLIVIAILAGSARGIATLLQATAITDRWGTAAYGTLSGILAGPSSAAIALAPWVGAALAGTLGGYPATFLVLAAFAVLATALAAGSIPPAPRTPLPKPPATD